MQPDAPGMMERSTAISGATLSRCHTYRYHLWRRIDCALNERGTCLFIMLNPSTADHVENDPTVERCQRRAMAAGFTRLEVCNIFALRSTDPKGLYSHPDPIGKHNDAEILKAARGAELVVCGWGEHGKLRERGTQVLNLLRAAGITPHALKINKGGNPCHPLYLPYSLSPVPMP